MFRFIKVYSGTRDHKFRAHNFEGGRTMQFKQRSAYMALGSVLVILGLLCIAFVTRAAGEAWTTKSNMPTARYGLAANIVEGKIYAIGGWGWGSGYLTTVEEYDPATDTWKSKRPMPTPRSGISAAIVNNKIYIIGGYGGLGGQYKYLSVVEEYDPSLDK